MERSPAYPAVTGKAIRRLILEQSMRAHVGHIGSALSVADILAALCDGTAATEPEGDRAHRDRFLLSKGHAALALYATLHLQGRMDRATLETYCGNGGFLGVHPERELDGVEFSAGSLGQGLGSAAGVALGKRIQGRRGRVRVLASDAELNEGSLWEAVMFAAQRKLDNLDLIIDLNGQQALGRTRDILDLSPLAPRFEAFGWRVWEADGHDAEALRHNLAQMARSPGRPQVLLARTVSGKGVGFMEGQVKWHYWPMSDAEYASALADLERTP
jgi:transketolase